MSQNNSPLLQAYSRLPIQMVRGEGAYLYDAQGKQYLDFAAGIAVVSLGHCHPKIVEALTDQAKTLWHSANLFTNPLQERLASRLNELSFSDKVFFCSSGLEALECAIKTIRKYSFDHHGEGRHRIITLKNGFHGRSMATISAGGNEIARRGFGPLLEGFDHVEPGDIQALEAAITDQTAGIILEPVQAEGGVYPLDKQYLRAVREIANTHKLTLCFDEVQCGYGRMGTLFAYEYYNVVPDMITVAKGIGGGYPLAACLMRDEIATAITPGTHGSTYGGSPLAMAVGNAVLDVIESKGFLQNITETGEYFHRQLQQLQKEFPSLVSAIRGIGLLQGIELTLSAKEVIEKLLEKGLIVTRAGGDRILRLVPPLIIRQNHVDEAIATLRAVLKQY